MYLDTTRYIEIRRVSTPGGAVAGPAPTGGGATRPPAVQRSASTISTVSSSSESTTRSAGASASGSGGKCGLGTATTAVPAADAARRPLEESSIAAQRSGAAPRRAIASRWTSGRGLAARDLLARDGRFERVGQPGELEEQVDDLAVGRASRARAASVRRAAHRVHRARAAAAGAPVELEHPPTTASLISSGESGTAELVVQVARPLQRAHPEHPRPWPPRASARRCAPPARAWRRPRAARSRPGPRRDRRRRLRSLLGRAPECEGRGAVTAIFGDLLAQPRRRVEGARRLPLSRTPPLP